MHHFLLNSIQEVIQKNQSSSLPFSFSYNFLKYYSFISQNNRIRVKSLKNKLFRQKSFMNYNQKTKKKKFSLYILGLVVVSISLSDESIKILEIQQQKHLIKSKVIEEWQFSLKRQSKLNINKTKDQTIRLFCQNCNGFFYLLW